MTPTRPLPHAWRVMALVAAGDLLAFVVFSILGQVSHQEAITLMGILRNALPLAVVWFPLGALLGAFRLSAVSRPSTAWWRVLVAWLPSGFFGMVVRSLWLQRPLWTPALFLFLAGNALLLVLWRTAVSLWLARRLLAVKEARQ